MELELRLAYFHQEGSCGARRAMQEYDVKSTSQKLRNIKLVLPKKTGENSKRKILSALIVMENCNNKSDMPQRAH